MKKLTRSTWTVPTVQIRWRKLLRKLQGVKHATVNFMTLKMSVEFEEGEDIKAVMQNVRANCKKVEDDCEIFI